MSIEKRPNGQWRARWREFPSGPQKAKHFPRKVDAERFLVGVEHSKLTGSYVDPARGKVTVASYAATWLERMRPTWRRGTIETVEVSVKVHIVPTLGHRPLGSIKRADVEAWASALKLAPGTVATVRQHLGQIFTAAVEDGLLARSPAAGARMPRLEPARAKPIPVDVLNTIEEYSVPWMRIAVVLGKGLGLRQAEATGLSVDRVDFLRRTVLVDRQLARGTGDAVVFGPPKTSASFRTIPLPTFVRDELAAHIAEHGLGDEGLILHLTNGRPIRQDNFNRAWNLAAVTAGAEGVHYHDTRHTFASTLLSSGVSVKAVADWLGHASPMITLQTYAHLMPVDEDRARGVLDAAFARAAGDSLGTGSG